MRLSDVHEWTENVILSNYYTLLGKFVEHQILGKSSAKNTYAINSSRPSDAYMRQ